MTYAAPLLPVETCTEVAYSRTAVDDAEPLLALPFSDLFYRLLSGYESEHVLAACQRIAGGFFTDGVVASLLDREGATAFRERRHLTDVLSEKDEFRRTISELFQEMTQEPVPAGERIRLVLLNRSPNALTEPCWLDHVSQPGTQPAKLVNDLFRIHCTRLGNGDPAKSAHRRFRQLCEQHGVALPGTTSIEFCMQEGLHDHAFISAVYHIALSRHARLFFPEIIGTTIAHYLLHIDPVSGEFDGDCALGHSEIFASLAALSSSERWPLIEPRIVRGFYTEANLERWFWKFARRLVAERGGETPRERMAGVLARIAKYAVDHHRNVMFEGRPLREWLNEVDRDPYPFIDALGNSKYFDKNDPARSKFFHLTSFDGPMFAIFSRADAKVVKEWAATLKDHEPPTRATVPARDTRGEALRFSALAPAARAKSTPMTRTIVSDDAACSPRELFYRLINVDYHAYVLPHAKAYVAEVLRKAESYLVDGAGAKYSDATFFAYAPPALEQRIADVYFKKLINGYEPLAQIPPKALVVISQKMLALGNLIDGTWIHKIGRVTQYGDRAANHVFGIYADEMGYGDMRLNHIMVMRRALDSMAIELPEMATREYAYNDTVPEKSFAFLNYELAISQFPQAYFAEALGLNLAIEMFGLGSFRLHEIRKLQHYGFDDTYERLHLTIDNVVTGHVKIAVQAVQAYLDDIRIRLGDAGVAATWRRVWLGYASLAQFVE